MRSLEREHCDVCRADAAVRMHGSTLCARCGLQRSLSDPAPGSRRARKAALAGLLSGGLLAKLLLGTVAVAAAAGLVVGPAMDEPAAGEPVESIAQTVSDAPPAQSTEMPSAEAQAQRAQALADQVRAWAACVSTAAAEHRGGPFDAATECGEAPQFTGRGNGYGLDNPAANRAAGIEDASPSEEPGRSGEARRVEEGGKSGEAPGRERGRKG